METIRTTLSGIIHRDRSSPWLMPLYALSLCFAGVISIRNLLYDCGLLTQKKAKTSVISVGNITVGGTGKTPTVITLAGLLQHEGYRPAVVSRGYGGRSSNPINVVSDGNKILMTPDTAGDEPVLIAQSLPTMPVITGKDRYVAAAYACRHFDIDIIILDDAFQHRALSRDVDILLLDAQRPFGNGWLIPGGALREPAGSVKRADIIVMTENERKSASSMAEMIEQRFPGKPVFSGYRRARDIVAGRSGESLPCSYVEGKTVFAFSGIARPDSFVNMIMSLGGIIVGTLILPDHHAYGQEDLARITGDAAARGAEIILTTEKDSMKLVDFTDFLRDIFVLRITIDVTPPGNFHELVLAKLA